MASTNIAKAYVQIVPSAEGIKGSITNVLEGESKSAGSVAGTNIVGSLKKIIIGAGIGKVLTDALMQGANLQQSFGGLDTIYGEASEAAKKYAVEAAKAGISANSYAEQAVSFGAALKSAFDGDTTKAAEAANLAIMDMADNAAKMGTPLENIQNAYQGFAKQNYTMLDNLKLGYGGTKTEMERLLADAQKFSGIEYDINNLGDVYSAIHVIQGELGLAGVAADEASNTFSGSFGAMKAACQNFLGSLTLGEDIKPALQTLVTTTFTFLTQNLLPMLVNIVSTIPSIVEEGIPLLMTEVKKLIPLLLDTGVNLIINLSKGLIKSIPTIVKSALEIVVALAKGIVKNIPKVISAGTSIFNDFKKKFTSLDWKSIGKNIMNGIVNGIKSMLTSIGNAAKNAAKTALNSIKNFLGIHSPSRVFETQVGKMISLGLAGGIEDNLKPVEDAMDSLNAETLGMIDRDFSVNKNVALHDNGQTDVLSKVLDVLASIEAKTEKDYSFSINGRQLAYALGGDMNIVLNQINQRESRGR